MARSAGRSNTLQGGGSRDPDRPGCAHTYAQSLLRDRWLGPMQVQLQVLSLLLGCFEGSPNRGTQIPACSFGPPNIIASSMGKEYVATGEARAEVLTRARMGSDMGVAESPVSQVVRPHTKHASSRYIPEPVGIESPHTCGAAIS